MNPTVERIGDLVERGVVRGTALLDSLVRSDSFPRSPLELLPRGACSCEIPPPCWLPRQLPPVTSHVCAGGRATLRIRVTNCSAEQTTVRLEVKGEAAKAVELSPAAISLGPLERGVLTASLPTDSKEGAGPEHELLVWIRGCLDHAVRWTVRTSSRGGSATHELAVEDCPDYLHHWYDHFYCARPCRPRQLG